MRVKRGTSHVHRRKRLLARTKGFRWGRKSLIRRAKTAVKKAGAHAYRDRRVKKRTARNLWTTKINAGSREHNVSYSRLINLLKKANVQLDRKSLSYLAEHHPDSFAALVKEISK
ncbi:MAG: 50S ribosomal protein L20 [Candidatus Kerfeldbacteria bacterium]|nr:50S ribosomal protein L20 [Candidatus Kerfeldbacteria bacterium]